MSSKGSKTLLARADDQIALWHLIEENNGELSPVMEEWLAEIETGLATKVDRYRDMMGDLDSEEARLRHKASEFQAAAQSVAQVSKGLRDRIKHVMQRLGVDEVKGELYRFKMTSLAPKLVIEDEAKVPAELKMVVTETVLDKDRIREALDAGIEVAGARLEPVFGLRDYVSKKK